MILKNESTEFFVNKAASLIYKTSKSLTHMRLKTPTWVGGYIFLSYSCIATVFFNLDRVIIDSLLHWLILTSLLMSTDYIISMYVVIQPCFTLIPHIYSWNRKIFFTNTDLAGSIIKIIIQISKSSQSLTGDFQPRCEGHTRQLPITELPICITDIDRLTLS
jgi:hypothetical protein